MPEQETIKQAEEDAREVSLHRRKQENSSVRRFITYAEGNMERDLPTQEARRILDRLYGYEVSPVLWKKVMPWLSAGRVQSVATRMVVERERARMQFRSATWWGVEGTFAAPETADRGPATFAPRWWPSTGPSWLPGAIQRRGRSRPPRARTGCSGARPDPWPTGLVGPAVHGPFGDREAVPPHAGAAVHDLDPPAGGRPQAPLQRPAGHAGGPAPVRAGLDHLHADRLDHAVRRGADGGPVPGHRSLRPSLRARRARAATSAR